MSVEQREEYDRMLNESDPVVEKPKPGEPVPPKRPKPPPWFRQGQAGVQSSLLAAQQLGIRPG